jgi:hypothetical protein
MNFINKVLDKVVEKAKKNNKHVCPICYHELSFDEFMIFKKEHLICPRCKSLDRHRVIYMFLLKKTDLFDDCHKKLLHISPCLTLCELFKMLYNVNYFPIGLNKQCTQVMDITNILYEDNVFDKFICSHVLEHVLDDDLAIQELYRVLSVGGWGLINVPIKKDKTFEDNSIVTPKDRKKHFGQYDHVRVYGKDFYKKLERHGFKVEIFESKDFLTEDEMLLFNVIRKKRGKGKSIIYCTK